MSGSARPTNGPYENQPLDQGLIKPRLGPKHLSDQDIRNISESLLRSGQARWSRVPRIYVVLHSIGQAQEIDTFIDDGISDIWFPFTQRTLPARFGDQKARKAFLEAQESVLSEILDFESGTRHHHFRHSSDVPLEKLSELGRGHFGYVDRVRSQVSFHEYARKLIPRGPNFRKNKATLKDFENELANLKKLSHIHTVQLKGSYTDPQFVGIIMSPIADCNLTEYMEGKFESSLLRNFFGCLAVAVRFLHDNSVRHKDIKPQNILVYKGRVLLTDFGTSLDWSETGHSTTSGPTTKTARYCAPEVANYASRNSSSDIWSLGCTFLEMWTAISGHSVLSLIQHLMTTGTESSCYHLNIPGIHSWYSITWPDALDSDGPLQWIQNMIRTEKNERWTADNIVDRIQTHTEETKIGFIGTCCDAEVGSPETVDTVIQETINDTPEATSSHHLQIETATIGDLEVGEMRLTTSSFSTSSISNMTSLETNATELPSLKPSEHTRNKRSGALLTEDATRRKKRDLSSPCRPPPLPNSFSLAQQNRFTADEVMRLLYGSQKQGTDCSRLTRSNLLGKPCFCYADYMLPDVVYAETCVRSKPSQYAPWSTLQSLIAHMTPATLRGYARFCPDASEGLASIPTIIPTGSDTDEVHGMLIFGWHDSHTTGSRKYASEHEHDEQRSVSITLRDGKKMEVEASLRVWNEDKRHHLNNYTEEWDPTYLTHGEWYSLMPESVKVQDNQLKIENPPVTDSEAMRHSSLALEKMIRTSPAHAESSVEYRLSQKDENLTNSLIPGLFYSGASYFLLRSGDSHAIDTALADGIWSFTPRFRTKLIRAMNRNLSSPIILFLFLCQKRSRLTMSSKLETPADGLYGIGVFRDEADDYRLASARTNVSLRIQWLVNAYIPMTQFSHLHGKDNCSGKNSGFKLISCRDGTELSLHVATELLSLFRREHPALFPGLSEEWTRFDGQYIVLTNPYASMITDVTLHCSFSLKSGDGYYALAISNDGKLVAGGCRVVELFEIDTGKLLWAFDMSQLAQDELYGASFSPDSKYFAAGGEKGVIYVFDVMSGQLEYTLTGHKRPIFSLEYTMSGACIVSGSEDKSVRLWDIQKFCESGTLMLESGCVTISASADSTTILAGTLDGKLASWTDLNNVSTVNPELLVKAHEDSIFSVRYLPNGTDIITGSRDRSVRLWSYNDVKNHSNDDIRSPKREFLGHRDSIYRVNASIDGKIIFSASGDGSIRLWDSKTGDTVSTILSYGLHALPVHDLSISGERSIFVSSNSQGDMRVWRFAIRT